MRANGAIEAMAAGPIPLALPLTGVWRPRIATATRYRWTNYRMRNGNFVDARLHHGRLSMEIKASGTGSGTPRRSGGRMFNDVFEHFGAENIEAFDATWLG